MGKVGYVCFKTKDWMGMFETYITSNGRIILETLWSLAVKLSQYSITITGFDG